MGGAGRTWLHSPGLQEDSAVWEHLHSLPGWWKSPLMENYCLKRQMTSQAQEHTHLQVEELAVASVNDFCAAIAPGHLDDVNLENQDIYFN